MGKKGLKRSKKASHRESEEERRSSHRSTEQSHEPLREAAAVHPRKVLNPFYIESNAQEEEEEEEHVGLLEYSNNMRDWNDDDGEYGINPYTMPHRLREAQQQQRNQLYFEWKIRIGLVVLVMMFVMWIILSLLHQNSPRSSSKRSPTASPIVNTYAPTAAPVAATQPMSLSTSPTLSPEEYHGRDGDTIHPILSVLPTLSPVGNAGDIGFERNYTDDGSFNDNND